MSVNNTIWELAEAYLAGSLPQDEFAELKQRLSSDTAFATEFYEATDLIRSVEGSGKHKRFRNMLRDIQQVQSAGAAIRKSRNIFLTPQLWRTVGVAASVAIIT